MPHGTISPAAFYYPPTIKYGRSNTNSTEKSLTSAHTSNTGNAASSLKPLLTQTSEITKRLNSLDMQYSTAKDKYFSLQAKYLAGVTREQRSELFELVGPILEIEDRSLAPDAVSFFVLQDRAAEGKSRYTTFMELVDSNVKAHELIIKMSYYEVRPSLTVIDEALDQFLLSEVAIYKFCNDLRLPPLKSCLDTWPPELVRSIINLATSIASPWHQG